MEIDWSVVAFETLNFGVLVIILRRFLFSPVQKAIEQRRKEIEALRTETQAREADAAATRDEYENKLRELDKDGRAQVDAAVADGHKRAGEVIDAGRNEAKLLVAAATRECETARRRALEGLRNEVFSLAADAATRVVKHMGAPNVAHAYTRLGAQSVQGVLEGMDAPPSEPILVLVGANVDPDEVESQLRAILGEHLRFEVDVDPEIVAGVRLRIGSHEVEASASASLRDWYAEQVGPDNVAVPSFGRAG